MFRVLRAFIYDGVLYVATVRIMIAGIGPAAISYIAAVCVEL